MKGQFPTVIQLRDLDGQNGFKLDGENNSDYSSLSVSAAGDINGDGHSDLVIGAYGYPAGNQKGRSYVVFGGSGVGSGGTIALSSLNGANGFKLDGENNYDRSGQSVSAAGDINGDGYADLIISAVGYPGGNNKGRNYLLFGGPNVGSSANIFLSSLNGSNGFKVDGENNNDYSGWTGGTAAGDVNGDHYSDLLIGAEGYPSGNFAGRTYVLFGKDGIGSTGNLLLSSLNGFNGFKLDGENNNDHSSWSASTVGDMNGDGVSDLVIGAPCHTYSGSSCGLSRSYVVFGGSGVGSSGNLLLSQLNGVNGFKLDGENNQDWSGVSVNTAGDMNGDGYADLIIGARAYPNGNNRGRAYVIFGGGNNGNIMLSSLNGSNGFKLDGENNNDYSSDSVSAAGDVNGDGYTDLIIGAPQYPTGNNRGRSYVVFGGPDVGSSGNFLLSSLNGVNGFKLDGENNSDKSGIVSAAGDINGDGVADIIIGAYGYPGGSLKGRCYVVFGDAPPVLVNNRLSLLAGSAMTLNATFLTAYDRNHLNNTIVFIPSNVTHGRFQLSTQPGIALINFTQPQLQNSLVQFVHDGSLVAPSYAMTVKSAGIAWTGPYPANISFTVPLTLTKNQLTLSKGQTVLLSLNNLQAIESGVTNHSQFVFSVNNVQNGYFATVPSGVTASKNLTSFTQAQIEDGAIQFVHTGALQAPSYSVLVSDGARSTLPSSASIDFAEAPIITQNQLNITTGSTLTLTPALLNVTIIDGSTPDQVVLTVSDLQHASLTSVVTGMPVTSFTLTDLQAGNIQLTQDGSLITPTLTVTARGVKQISSTPSITNVYFSDQGIYAPRLMSNYLSVTQGAATTLSSRYLSAKQLDGLTLDNSTLFYISDISHGHFSLVPQPQTRLSFFNQGQLDSGQIQFVHDGTLSIPGYRSAVQAFGLQSASLQAGIFFTVVNDSPPSLPVPGNTNDSTVQKAIIGSVVSGTVGIFFAVLQACLKYSANKKLLQALGETKDDYDLNVVRPIAKEIARRIKITGFMNATTNRQMNSFKSAVRSLLASLDDRGVDLNLTEMKAVNKDKLLNEIGHQVELWVKQNRRGCTACCPGLMAFFKPQFNPENLRAAADDIADKVAIALQKRTQSQPSVGAGLLASSSPIYSSAQSQHSVELSQIDSPSQKTGKPEEASLGDSSVAQLS